MLILDTNVLISGIIKGKVLDIIFELYDKGIKLFCPQLVLEEIKSKLPIISKQSKLSEEVVLFFFSNLFLEFVKPIPKEEYEEFISEAKRISPHLKDAPLFALSLSFDKAPIWSREPRLKRQSVVNVLNDEDVEEVFDIKLE